MPRPAPAAPVGQAPGRGPSPWPSAASWRSGPGSLIRPTCLLRRLLRLLPAGLVAVPAEEEESAEKGRRAPGGKGSPPGRKSPPGKGGPRLPGRPLQKVQGRQGQDHWATIAQRAVAKHKAASR